MSNPHSCDCACDSPQVVSTPGTSGENAYSTLTANSLLPALGANFTVSLSNTGWMVVGEIVVVTGPGYFQVVSKTATSAVLTFLDYPDQFYTPGDTVHLGIVLSPSGVKGPVDDPLLIANGGTGQATAALALDALLQSAPLPVAQGGTAGTTKTTAQTALGLGQDAVISTVTGLTQAVTASSVQIAGCSVTVPALGSYLITGIVAIGITGAQFNTSRTVTLKVRNVTQGVDLFSTTRSTGILATVSLPAQEITVPWTMYSTGAVSDNIQLFIAIDVVQTAGTYLVNSATLCITPLRKS